MKAFAANNYEGANKLLNDVLVLVEKAYKAEFQYQQKVLPATELLIWITLASILVSVAAVIIAVMAVLMIKRRR